MSRRARTRLGAAAVLALVLVVALSPPARLARPPLAGAPARLLGPIASAGADLLWLRVEAARRAGRHDLVFARAELALRLDPGATDGWSFLAHHQALHLGSVLREPDPGRRALFLRAGVETAARGERVARRPEDLALLRGILLQTHAENDPATAWRGGTDGLWRDAAAAYARAAELGHPAGEPLAASALESLSPPGD